MNKEKIIDSISMVNPCKQSLEDLVRMQFDFFRRGYHVRYEDEKVSDEVIIVKLVVYDK